MLKAEDNGPGKKGSKKEKDKEEVKVLAGTKEYDYNNLANTKKILTGRGSI